MNNPRARGSPDCHTVQALRLCHPLLRQASGADLQLLEELTRDRFSRCEKRRSACDVESGVQAPSGAVNSVLFQTRSQVCGSVRSSWIHEGLHACSAVSGSACRRGGDCRAGQLAQAWTPVMSYEWKRARQLRGALIQPPMAIFFIHHLPTPQK